MTNIVHIFSHSSEHTTAKYFYRVLQSRGIKTIYWDKCPNLDLIESDDIFFFIDPAPDWPIGMEKIRCLAIAYLIDVHQGVGHRISLSKFFDRIFIAQVDYLQAFSSNMFNLPVWIPLACDPTLYKNNYQVRDIDLSFIGALGAPKSYRNKVLTKIFEIYPHSFEGKFISPFEMGKKYSRSKIVFNISINGDLNMRFFEALGSGALLITDRIQNGLSNLFVEGEHYVGYSSANEALEKIKFYLENDDARLKIAKAGQKLALKSHTYNNRWDAISLEMEMMGDKREAPARHMMNKQLVSIYTSIYLDIRKPLSCINILFKYGMTTPGIINLVHSLARYVNNFVPITPNAINFRIRNFSKKYRK